MLPLPRGSKLPKVRQHASVLSVTLALVHVHLPLLHCLQVTNLHALDC